MTFSNLVDYGSIVLIALLALQSFRYISNPTPRYKSILAVCVVLAAIAVILRLLISHSAAGNGYILLAVGAIYYILLRGEIRKVKTAANDKLVWLPYQDKDKRDRFRNL